MGKGLNNTKQKLFWLLLNTIFKNIYLSEKLHCLSQFPQHHWKVIELNGKFSEQATHTGRKESYHMKKIIPEKKGESHNHGFTEYIKRINLFLEISCKAM